MLNRTVDEEQCNAFSKYYRRRCELTSNELLNTELSELEFYGDVHVLYSTESD